MSVKDYKLKLKDFNPFNGEVDYMIRNSDWYQRFCFEREISRRDNLLLVYNGVLAGGMGLLAGMMGIGLALGLKVGLEKLLQ